MSEGTEEKPAGATEDSRATEEQKPAGSETDWKAEARKWEQRAKENTEAAKKLAALEEANKTELQKAQERIKELEQRSTQAERAALRTRIAAETGVPVEVLHGDDEDSIKASAQKVLDWRDSNKKQPPSPKKLTSGNGGEPKTGEKGRAAAALRSLRQG